MCDDETALEGMHRFCSDVERRVSDRDPSISIGRVQTNHFADLRKEPPAVNSNVANT